MSLKDERKVSGVRGESNINPSRTASALCGQIYSELDWDKLCSGEGVKPMASFGGKLKAKSGEYSISHDLVGEGGNK